MGVTEPAICPARGVVDFWRSSTRGSDGSDGTTSKLVRHADLVNPPRRA